MTLNPFHDTSLFYACWKHQEISDFLIYFGEYRKRAVAWNVLIKIFLANMSTECWYSCLFHNRACFLTVDLHSALVLSIPLKKCKVSMFSDLSWFQGTLLRDCFRWVFMATNWNTVLIITYILKVTSWKNDFFFIVAYILN